MTFNIAHGRGRGLYQGFTRAVQLQRNIGQIAALLRDMHVDIAAMQEIDEDSHWHHGVRLMDSLREACAFPHCVMGVNNRREGPKPLAYGNALFSRYPVELWDNQPFGNATLGEKGFLYAELQVGAALLLPVVNLHLDFRSKERRIKQVERLVEYMRARPARADRTHLPPVICGDFNSGSGRAGDAVKHLFNHLVEHDNYQLYPVKARTFPAYWPRWGLDFLFIPGSFKVLSHGVLPTRLSDHRPVILEVEIPEMDISAQ